MMTRALSWLRELIDEPNDVSLETILAKRDEAAPAARSPRQPKASRRPALRHEADAALATRRVAHS